VKMPQPGTSIGPYTIVKLLGQGNMGAVYEAVDPITDQTVALKITHPEYDVSERFLIRFERWLEFKSFSPLEVLTILAPLCDALDYAHTRNILHRDVKPSTRWRKFTSISFSLF